jgi:hypothetical protein
MASRDKARALRALIFNAESCGKKIIAPVNKSGNCSQREEIWDNSVDITFRLEVFEAFRQSNLDRGSNLLQKN